MCSPPSLTVQDGAALMAPRAFKKLLVSVLCSVSVLVIVTFIFTYPDTPGMPDVYVGKGRLLSTDYEESPFSSDDFESAERHPAIDLVSRSYVLNTSKCVVPDFDPHDPATAAFFREPLKTCTNKNAKPLLFKAEVTAGRCCPVLNHDVITQHYPDLKIDSLTCVYQELNRDTRNTRPDAAYVEELSKSYTLGSCPSEENIWMMCKDASNKTYSQPLLLPKARPSRQQGDGPRLNVLVLGIDALSRLNFMRQMNRTRHFLEDRYTFVEMFGYNKIGENSAPNQIPMMTGVSYNPGLMDRAIGNYFDGLTEYIWDFYQKHGFNTMFFEEQWETGLFIHPSMQGFRQVPTDYWPRPLMQKLDASKLKAFDGNGLCVGGEYAAKFYLEYLLDALEVARHNNPLFAYAWFSELSHDQLNGARRADDDFAKFFRLLDQRRLSQETVILFLSDHGSRLEKWRGTVIGRYEDMLPFFYALLPPQLVQKRPDVIKKLTLNSRRLITAYDIHATLLELASPWAEDRERKRGQGLSLISHEVPESRTCLEAGINLQFCSCLRPTRIGRGSKLAQRFAHFVIDTVNGEIERNGATSICYTWTFQNIFDIFELEDLDKQFQIYKVLLIAVPQNLKGAVFEASAIFRNNSFELLSRIERLDWYSAHADCVKGKNYARYCYCRQNGSTHSTEEDMR
ncbi:hypothetical protein BIW11_00469 [Tropilaelaps mercedesae]|uniref:DUF229 domain containing protein n=1 Tax=Tropilaelaps mercedesae TaxID=418985 RepID=A0A1V9XUP9_9ACAR|nr:hypothetical protein BIW11_00469 [Tropilaelaps mercedesae]